MIAGGDPNSEGVPGLGLPSAARILLHFLIIQPPMAASCQMVVPLPRPDTPWMESLESSSPDGTGI